MIEQVTDQLLQSGWEREFIESLLMDVDARLKDAPLQFGEPLYGIRGMDLTVAVGFVRPLCVEFSVSEARKLVLVRGVKVMVTS